MKFNHSDFYKADAIGVEKLCPSYKDIHLKEILFAKKILL